jgi:rhamnosyltransferase
MATLPARGDGRIASITVAFNPEPDRILAQLDALADQVDDVIIVDNASRQPAEELVAHCHRPVHLLRLDANAGMARGMNLGIREARRLGARYVLLLDHDSVPQPGMIAALGEAMEEAARGPQPVAAVGPRIRDPRDPREYPFIRLRWLRNEHRTCRAGEAIVPCDFLISSGVMLRLEALDAIGDFDESLFIDNVDLEWCFRARRLGFALYGACAAVLDHRLGDERKRVCKGVELVVHPPERTYYMTRNRLRLYARASMPLKWKYKDLLRAMAKFTATVLFVPPRREYARMTWRGIRDAFGRRGGALGLRERPGRPSD